VPVIAGGVKRADPVAAAGAARYIRLPHHP